MGEKKRPLHPSRISRVRAGGDFRFRARQIGSGEARRGRFLSRVDRSAVHKKSPEDSRVTGNPAHPGGTLNPPDFLFPARHTGAENEGSRPNRMETRFLGIAYRKFTEGIGPPVCDLTNELYPTCAGIGLAWIAPPAGERRYGGQGCPRRNGIS